ncbi:hypothetical protein GCM10010399_41380 [Dactylosporangium fulvum]|uniref:Uncharacterized protein n=1 Tax=Dactylosporangium fulvum TaxID=53359 RepID=A0ABY5W0W0_9ACTN|nr:hypothetical protein [Dactylosporangium fulvum]UWP82333.1 hypothetical protein Dfulv_46005 [Dactylosporangium fulvum]
MEMSAALAGGAVCLGLVVALVIVLTVVQQRRERVERLRQWAAQHGWQYTVRPQVEWGRRMPGRNKRGSRWPCRSFRPVVAVIAIRSQSRARRLDENRPGAWPWLRQVRDHACGT